MTNHLPKLVGVALVFLAPSIWAGKVDEALNLERDSWYPIFVRMEDQLICKAGEYDAFCRKRSKIPRSRNRAEVISTLREKADQSWDALEEVIEDLRQKERIRGVRRFWIVNGFSCRAKAGAIRRLSMRKEVSFVYLDRFARPPAESEPMDANRTKRMQTVLETWGKKEPEFIPSLRIPWNVREIGAERAWKEENATGRGVKVAVIDSGILPTPSLVHALAKNPNEKLNGMDDDGNGLIDDLFGYDFNANTGYVLENGRTMSHGSCCAGIVAGRASARGWQTGIAPQSRLLLLKGAFNLRSMEYLLEQGADVVSMSYMIVGRELGQVRGLFRNAFEHLGAAGVLSVGGAGNYGSKSRRALPRGKQIGLPKDIPSVLAVAGVDKNRVPLPFSSQGPVFWEGVEFFSDYPSDKPLGKPDLTAFPTGYPMWSAKPSSSSRRGWKEVSEAEGASLVIGPAGNSFSGPHGAGVAALIFSANPEINSWEVSEILQKTAQDLGPKGWDKIYGAGLIDALAAVRAAKKKD